MKMVKAIFYTAALIFLSYMIGYTLFNVETLSNSKAIFTFGIRCLALITIAHSFISLFITRKEAENVR